MCAAMPEFPRLLVDCEVGQRLDEPPKDRTPTQQEIKHHVLTDMRDVDIGAESASSFCGRQSSRNSWSGDRPLQHTNHADDMSPNRGAKQKNSKGHVVGILAGKVRQLGYKHSEILDIHTQSGSHNNRGTEHQPTMRQ